MVLARVVGGCCCRVLLACVVVGCCWRVLLVDIVRRCCWLAWRMLLGCSRRVLLADVVGGGVNIGGRCWQVLLAAASFCRVGLADFASF